MWSNSFRFANNRVCCESFGLMSAGHSCGIFTSFSFASCKGRLPSPFVASNCQEWEDDQKKNNGRSNNYSCLCEADSSTDKLCVWVDSIHTVEETFLSYKQAVQTGR